jgi:lipid-A-disaccharide synthase
MSNKSILIIAGEVSGDIHGANLIREMKNSVPNLHFFGIGGDRMKEEGAELFYHINQMSLIGLTEIIKHLPFVFNVINRIVLIAKERNPDLIILIDYPGLNIRIGKRLKKLKKRIFYYISPQVWAWGKNRIKKIAEFTDKMVVILPFEEEIYQNAGIDVEFVGNPLLDIVKTDLTKEEFFTKNQLSRNKITIGLLPGSRIQEIRNLLPEMLKAMKIITEKMENVQGIISVSPSIEKSVYDEIIERNFPVKSVEKFNYPIMKYSDLLIVASGTATLEATIFETPMIIVYKVSPITFLFAKLFVKIPYIGLANILAKEKIVPEIIQKKLLGEEIAKEIEKVIKNTEIMEKMRENLGRIKTMLGSSGASKRAAELALKLIN